MRDAKLRAKIKLESYVTADVGLPTLNDIVAELAKPGRDPREKFEAFSFAEGVNKPEDLKPGMKLPGIVTNVTAFGAFVDIGVHQDGLVHVSQLADTFVKDPARRRAAAAESDGHRHRSRSRPKPHRALDAQQAGDRPEVCTWSERRRSHESGRPAAGIRSAPGCLRSRRSRRSRSSGDWFSAALNKKK